MILAELFNDPYKWFWVDNYEDEFTAKFEVDDGSSYVVIGYIKDPSPPDVWYIEFSRIEAGVEHYEHGITNTGDQLKIFATIIEILQSFLLERKDELFMISFSAKEPSRRKLYQRIINTLFSDWKQKVDGSQFLLYHPGL